jgi:hypothetical protein
MENQQKPRTVVDVLGEGLVAVGDGIKTGAIVTCRFVKRYWKPIVITGLTFAAGIATAIVLSRHDEENNDMDFVEGGDENEMKMPQDIHDRLAMFWDPVKADEWAELMENGEITLEEATAQADMWEKHSAEIVGRRDIRPEEWRDFEDGWRPQGW